MADPVNRCARFLAPYLVESPLVRCWAARLSPPGHGSPGALFAGETASGETLDPARCRWLVELVADVAADLAAMDERVNADEAPLRGRFLGAPIDPVPSVEEATALAGRVADALTALESLLEAGLENVRFEAARIECERRQAGLL